MQVIKSSFLSREYFLFPRKDPVSCLQLIRILKDVKSIPSHVEYYLPEFVAIKKLINNPRGFVEYQFNIPSQIQRFGALLLISQEFFTRHDIISILKQYIRTYGLKYLAILSFVMRASMEKIGPNTVLALIKNRHDEMMKLNHVYLSYLLIGLMKNIVLDDINIEFFHTLNIDQKKMEKITHLFRTAFLSDFIDKNDQEDIKMFNIIEAISKDLSMSIHRATREYMNNSSLIVFFHSMRKNRDDKYTHMIKNYKDTLRCYLLEILNFRFMSFPDNILKGMAFDVIFYYRKKLAQLVDEDPLLIGDNIDEKIDTDTMLDAMYALQIIESQKKSFDARGIPVMTSMNIKNFIDSYNLEDILKNEKSIIMTFLPSFYMVCLAKIQTYESNFCRDNRSTILNLGKMLILSPVIWSLSDNIISNFFTQSICPIFAQEIQTFVHDFNVLYYWLTQYDPNTIREKVDFFLTLWPDTFRLSYCLAMLEILIEKNKSTIRSKSSVHKYLTAYLNTSYIDMNEYNILLENGDIKHYVEEQNPLDKLF